MNRVDSKLVSVVVPAYNVEEYIANTIESIICQTYGNIEIIIVDDGSTDNTGNICDHYSSVDPRISVLHTVNNGCGAARNLALEHANGSYYFFVDGDDIIHPMIIRRAVECAEANNVAIVICGSKRITQENSSLSDDRSGVTQVISSFEFLRDYMANGDFVRPGGKLYSKAVWGQTRFPAGKLNEDAFVQHHLYYAAGRIAYIDEALYGYMQHDGSIMAANRDIKYFDALEAFCDRITFYHGLKGYKPCIFKTIDTFWNWFFRRIPLDNNSDLQDRVRKLNGKALLIWYQLQAPNYSWKGKLALILLLINPGLYLRIVKH